MAPASDPDGGAVAQSSRLTPLIDPTSTSRWSVEIHDGGMLSTGTNGILATPLGEITEIDAPNT
jgi:hypothetical protein